MIDERDFMRAVYDLGDGDTKGWISGEDIMRRLGLKPSELVDLDKHPTTDDDRSYKTLARSCDKRGYIKQLAGTGGSYSWVAITDWGIDYAEGG